MEIPKTVLERLADPLWRIENLYKIRTKRGKLELFNPNKAQREYLKNQTLRDIILKSRQLGFSTLKLIQLLDRAMFTPNCVCVVIAHEREKMEKLFRIVKTAYENYPGYLPKPLAAYDNRNELTFPEINSSISIALDARSMTVTHLHVSELAFMEDAEERFLASIASVVPEGTVCIESTANGIGNFFYDFWMEASDRGYKQHFFPWFYAEEYRKSPIGMTFDMEDRAFQKKFELDEAQLTWWKQGRATYKEKFAEEYPSFPEESFLMSGSSAFPQDKLALMKVVEPVSKRHDGLMLFENPAPGRMYAVGVDTAEGLATSDENALDVVDIRTGKQVAHLSGKFPIPQWAELVHEVSLKYNNALIIPEANNHGHALIYMLSEKKANIYKREKFEKGARVERSERLGWLTTSRSKSLLIGEMNRALYEDDVEIVCSKTVKQMREFIHRSDGQTGAPDGKHDDCVMSFLLAWQGVRVLAKTAERQRQSDYDRKIGKIKSFLGLSQPVTQPYGATSY